MKILYIENNFICNSDIQSAFSALGHELIIFSAPPTTESEQSTYLQNLLAQVKTSNPVFIFSIDFSPFLSLACGVFQMPYICWLVKGYDPDYYNASIRNEWNFVFVADSALCTNLQTIGVANTYYLPLAAPNQDSNSSEIPETYIADISFIGTIHSRNELPAGPMSSGNELRDATKGYLDGCIACQAQIRTLPPMCSNLPSYVWDDLVHIYPPQVANRLNTAAQYYDYTFFDDIITYTDREASLLSFTNESRYKRINLYNSSTKCIHERIKNCGWADYHSEIPSIAKGSIINLEIHHRHNRSGISPTAWAIMGAGGFLLSNYQEDFTLLTSARPALFQNAYEMRSKAAYYYHHTDERNAITNLIYEEISQKHTYLHRISELLSIIS